LYWDQSKNLWQSVHVHALAVGIVSRQGEIDTKETLLVFRYSLFVKSKNIKKTNGYAASAVCYFLRITNDE